VTSAVSLNPLLGHRRGGERRAYPSAYGACDGRVLVLYDILGLTPGRRPRFSRAFPSGKPGIGAALASRVRAFKDRTFPGPEHTFE